MNLFDVTRGHEPHTGPRNCKRRNDGPRAANKDEVRAYLKWIASERGIYVPVDATFSPEGIESKSAGGLILEMPGYGQKQIATCELLNDAGEVLHTVTLPQDKRGGIPATAKQVQEWSGLKPVKAKRGKAAATLGAISQDCAPILDDAPAQAQEAAPVAHVEPEAIEAPHAAPEPEISAVEPVTVADELPAPLDLGDIAARIDALEAALASLSVKPAPIVEQAPEPVARRTAAHERAVRRAWAARKEARLQRAVAADHMRMREQTQEALQAEVRDHDRTRSQWRKRLDEFAEQGARLVSAQRDKRRRAVMLGRDLQKRLNGEYALVDRANQKRSEAEEAARDWSRKEQAQREHADVLASQLAKLKRDMADPSQPERASDIARLMSERDTARTALAAVTARADRQQASLNQMAEHFEAMVSRVTMAEAAVRKMAAA